MKSLFSKGSPFSRKQQEAERSRVRLSRFEKNPKKQLNVIKDLPPDRIAQALKKWLSGTS
jgi:hypothetical protein